MFVSARHVEVRGTRLTNVHTERAYGYPDPDIKELRFLRSIQRYVLLKVVALPLLYPGRRHGEPFDGYCRRELPLVCRVRGLQTAHLPLRPAIAQGDRSSWCACRRNQRGPRKPRYVVFRAVRKATWLTSGCSRDVQGAHAGPVRIPGRQTSSCCGQ